MSDPRYIQALEADLEARLGAPLSPAARVAIRSAGFLHKGLDVDRPPCAVGQAHLARAAALLNASLKRLGPNAHRSLVWEAAYVSSFFMSARLKALPAADRA